MGLSGSKCFFKYKKKYVGSWFIDDIHNLLSYIIEALQINQSQNIENLKKLQTKKKSEKEII